MRQQLEIEGSDSLRKETAAKLAAQRNSEYFDIQKLGSTGAGSYDGDEGSREQHVGAQLASEYSSIDAGKYERHMYAVEIKKAKFPKDKFGRAVGDDEADLIKNENEMANIKSVISDDDGSYYTSARFSGTS